MGDTAAVAECVRGDNHPIAAIARFANITYNIQRYVTFYNLQEARDCLIWHGKPAGEVIGDQHTGCASWTTRTYENLRYLICVQVTFQMMSFSPSVYITHDTATSGEHALVFGCRML